jgi:hypothetical protein
MFFAKDLRVAIMSNTISAFKSGFEFKGDTA